MGLVRLLEALAGAGAHRHIVTLCFSRRPPPAAPNLTCAVNRYTIAPGLAGQPMASAANPGAWCTGAVCERRSRFVLCNCTEGYSACHQHTLVPARAQSELLLGVHQLSPFAAAILQ